MFIYLVVMEKIIRTFKALSDPVRLRVLFLLAERDLCVCELMAVLRIEQSLLSHQLRILRNAGLVRDRKEGRWIIYSIGTGVRDDLVRPLLEFAGPELAGSNDILRDRERVDICLRDNVRGKMGGAS